MTWIFLAIGSALFLGVYDIMKKLSLNQNAVLPTLLFSSLSGALIFTVPVILSKSNAIPEGHLLFVPDISLEEHLFIILKTIIVLSSWILAFFALKNLPITIVAPIRSTSPVWTLIGAIIIFQEQLTVWQWVGLMVTLVFFYLFSTTGKLEGIRFRSNKYIWFIILATLIGGGSGVYDKFLMQRIDRMAVQTYFTFYQVLFMLAIVSILWWPKRRSLTPFQWRWTIPLIGTFLVIADFLYFYALTDPEALISIISALRRVSVIITFLVGALIFKEQNIRKKGYFLMGILIGVLIIVLSG